jgi:putative transposase
VEVEVHFRYRRLMARPRKPASPFRYFHSSPEVIRLVVMMYVRFPLSLRNDEDLLFEPGIDLCHETVRHWRNRFGPLFASDPPTREPHARLPPVEVAFRRDVRDPKGSAANLNGEMVYLWRAVDHDGEILESFVTKKRDRSVALAFMKKALKCRGRPEFIVTDGQRSYPAAVRQLGNFDRREMGRWMNNRVENSQLPFRRRERAMLRFDQMKTLQKFASVHASISNHLNLDRHLVDRNTYKLRRSVALAAWPLLKA